jgi:hypothetical protein
MNLNELAVNLAKLEGKKEQVNIAQIKEIISDLGVIFANQGTVGFLKLARDIRNHGKEKLKCCNNKCECKE